jgi:hypothetical protein
MRQAMKVSERNGQTEYFEKNNGNDITYLKNVVHKSDHKLGFEKTSRNNWNEQRYLLSFF